MKNPIVIFVVVAVIAVLGIGAYTFSQNPSQSESLIKEDEAMLQKDTQETIKDDTVDNSDNSRYVEYSKATLDQAAGNRRVLFFYASWCPTCRPTDADLKENADKIPEDLTVIRVNYSDPETDQEEKDLAKKYGITYQHTFVQIDSTGNEVTKWNGGQTKELLSNSK